MRKYYGVSLLLIFLLAVVPCVPLMMACFIAGEAKCELNVGDAYRCIIYGHDYGAALYIMGKSLWLIAFTLPLAQIAFNLWAIILAIHLVVRLRSKRRGARQA